MLRLKADRAKALAQEYTNLDKLEENCNIKFIENIIEKIIEEARHGKYYIQIDFNEENPLIIDYFCELGYHCYLNNNKLMIQWS
jgi:hypothetical protein